MHVLGLGWKENAGLSIDIPIHIIQTKNRAYSHLSYILLGFSNLSLLPSLRSPRSQFGH